MSFILNWKKSLFTRPSNVLPLHLVFSSSQNSNVDNILPDLDKIPPRPFWILRTLLISTSWHVKCKKMLGSSVVSLTPTNVIMFCTYSCYFTLGALHLPEKKCHLHTYQKTFQSHFLMLLQYTEQLLFALVAWHGIACCKALKIPKY